MDEEFEEDYEEMVDEAQDEIEENQDIKDAQADSYGTFPEGKPQESLYNWFWKVVRLKKPFQLVKVGNLNKDEIGLHRISVRDAMNLWVLGNIFHHQIFGNYFSQVAKVTSASSMAKEGWFMDLSISQKKVRERKKIRSQQQSNQKWKIFNRKEPGQEQ